MVRDGEFSRDLPRAYPARDACRGLFARLSERQISGTRRGGGMGALSGQWRHRPGPAARRPDAQLGAASPALSRTRHPRKSRHALSLPDGRNGGRDDQGMAVGAAAGGIAPVANVTAAADISNSALLWISV